VLKCRSLTIRITIHITICGTYSLTKDSSCQEERCFTIARQQIWPEKFDTADGAAAVPALDTSLLSAGTLTIYKCMQVIASKSLARNIFIFLIITTILYSKKKLGYDKLNFNSWTFNESN
jgi:hypothetical protein